MRTITPGYSNINQAKGRIIEKADNSAIVFPINGVNVKFIGSSFEGGGASEFDTAIPYIGLGFEVN